MIDLNVFVYHFIMFVRSLSRHSPSQVENTAVHKYMWTGGYAVKVIFHSYIYLYDIWCVHISRLSRCVIFYHFIELFYPLLPQPLLRSAAVGRYLKQVLLLSDLITFAPFVLS
jgi:hypothetical protein